MEMSAQDVRQIAAQTYRDMSVIEQNRECPICKAEVTMIGVRMLKEANNSELGFDSKIYSRCLGCLTLFEDKLVAAPKTITSVVNVTFPVKQGAKVRAPRVKLTPK